jgi:hypothetical protein
MAAERSTSGLVGMPYDPPRNRAACIWKSWVVQSKERYLFQFELVEIPQPKTRAKSIDPD